MTTTPVPVDPANDVLRPFVPRLAVDWLRESPEATARSFEGTLLFADVSGFTALTEALAQHGREGAEEIADVLDAAFTELIGAAYAQQADLLKFGGDAVLLLFRGDDHARRAGSAAMAMQASLLRMRRRSTSAGPVRLGISIGIHTDVFDFFLVGGVHRELIVAGAGATACVEVEKLARSGEVALTPQTAALIEPELLVTRSDGVMILAESPESPAATPAYFDPSGIDLAKLMPAAYTRELRGDPGEPEHRHVAVAFVELADTDELLAQAGADALAEALEESITSIQEACLALDVTFAQTDVSSGGVKVILLAGAPRAAGGEEEELVLRAARAIVEAQGGLPVRVGVNSGMVFAGVIGAPTRRTYTFYGDTINTAARIMARAELGEVMAHEGALTRARSTFLTTPVEPFAAKGKAEPIRAARIGIVQGERQAATEGPFVGREAELEALVATVEQARADDGTGAVIVVTGEAGLGKTRLLSELHGRTASTRTIRVRCDQAAGRVPYSTIAAIVRRALGVEVHAPASLVERQLRKLLSTEAPELEQWVALIGLAVGLDLPDTPESAALDDRFVPDLIASSTVDFLDSIVPGPAVIVVDDAHAMDEASEAIVLDLAARAAHRRSIVVLAGHDSPDGGLARPEGVETTELALEPLSRGESLALVQRLTEDAPLAAHVAEAVAARSAGSPLFITELVSAVREGTDVAELPRSVEALLAVQIDELSSSDRATLRQASVLGVRFNRTALIATLELGEAEVDGQLARLDRFLVTEGAESIRFRHGLIRDAAYDGLSYRRRRSLHRRAGESLESEAGDDPSAVTAELSRHFFEAGMWEKALRYGTAAGESAATVYANVDAVVALRRAVTAGTRWRGARPEAVMSAAETLGEALLALGELERAGDAFVTARRRVRGDVVENARLLRKEATVAYRLGRLARAQRLATRALGLLEGVQSTPAAAQRARLEAWLGVIFLARGEPRTAVDWLRRAVEDGDAVGAKKASAHALAALDLAYNRVGEPTKAIYSRRALRLYEELGDLVSVGGVLNNLGTTAYYVGRWDDALDLYQRALAAWDRAGDARSVSTAAFNVGEILSAQGRLDEAEPLLRDAERASRAAGGAADIAESVMETALLEARRGDIGRALARLDEARALLLDEGDPASVLVVDARVAEALALNGDYDDAAALASDAVERAAVVDGGALVRPTLQRVLGQAHRLAGRTTDARSALELAVAEATTAQHRYEEALALDALVRLGDAPTSVASRRDRLFERLGIVELPAPWTRKTPRGRARVGPSPGTSA